MYYMKCSGLFTTCASENTAPSNPILCIIEYLSFDYFFYHAAILCICEPNEDQGGPWPPAENY